jgi:hypothetical protein
LIPNSASLLRQEIVMTTVVWLTDDLGLLPGIEAATSFANATLQVCTQIQELPQTHIPIILWSPASYDEATYLQLTEHCDQVIQLIVRDNHHQRLCPIKSKGAPRYYIVVPFDPEEAGIIIQGVAERAAKARER